MTRRARLALLLCLSLGPVAGCARLAERPSPYFRPSADQIGPALNSYGEAVVPAHGLVVVQGDDLAYGATRRPTRNRINGADEGQATTTISESLRHVLGRSVQVENRGFPGDTAEASAERWADAPAPSLLILALGYGDLRAHTQVGPFGAAVRDLIRKAHEQGAAVFVVLPPASSDRLTDANLWPYRSTLDAVARSEGAEVFAAAVAMATGKEPPAQHAGQTAHAYTLIAGAMAPYIKVVAPAA
jgi:hypothetical protein